MIDTVRQGSHGLATIIVTSRADAYSPRPAAHGDYLFNPDTLSISHARAMNDVVGEAQDVVPARTPGRSSVGLLSTKPAATGWEATAVALVEASPPRPKGTRGPGVVTMQVLVKVETISFLVNSIEQVANQLSGEVEKGALDARHLYIWYLY